MAHAEELCGPLLAYHRAKRSVATNSSNRRRRQCCTRRGRLAQDAAREAISRSDGILLGAEDLLGSPPQPAALIEIAEKVVSQLGERHAHVGSLAQQLADAMTLAAARVRWTAHEVFALLVVPTLACMCSQRTRAFGIVLAASKLLWVVDDWPDENLDRAKDLSKIVVDSLLHCRDILAGVWLLGRLRLDLHVDFEHMYALLRGNVQALRVYCACTVPEAQHAIVKRITSDACNSKTRKERREGLSVAADLIARCGLKREDFPEVARQKAINWFCYMLHGMPAQTAEDIARGDCELLTLCIERFIHSGRLDAAVKIWQRNRADLDSELRTETLDKLRGIEAAYSSNGGNPCANKREDASLDKDLDLIYDVFGPRDQQSLELPVPETDVIWAGSRESVREVEAAVRDAALLGIDLEWSSFGDWLQPKLALLQIAICNRVYLVDLSNEDLVSSIGSLFHTMLSKDQPLVLGFSLKNDFRELDRSVWREFCRERKGICDLQTLFAREQIKPGDRRQEGLSSVAHRTLGRRVCKAEQRSGWHRRPLRASQRHYAALDAYVLLQLAESLVASSGASLRDPAALARALENLASG